MDWQRRFSTWAAPRWQAIDLALSVFFFVGGSIALALSPLEGSQRGADAVGYLLIAAAAASVYWRRTKPLHALIAGTALVVAYWVLDYPAGHDPVLWILFYSAVRHGGPNRRRVWQITGLALATIVSISIVGVIIPTEDLPWLAIVGILLIHGTAAVIGEARYQRDRYIAELEQQNALLEADIESKAALAAVEERTRIAREMHDIIAHGMSSVVVQAQAAQSVVGTNPAQASEVLRTIETIGRDSVDEMRRMLGVLRNGDAALDFELAPQPSLDDVGELRRQVAAAGIEFDLAFEGGKRPLSPGVELAAYRIVQEALTNVIRHAGRPVAVDVLISFEPDALTIDILDDGLGAAASPDTGGTGHGLLGMRERVDIYGGSLRAGPRPGGGFEVRASLPTPSRVNA